MPARTRACLHRIDAADVLDHVDDSWVAFAEQNGAPELTRAAVLGRSLWGFIDGEETRTLYRHVLEAVRSSRKKARFPFRCDAPDRRRWMDMEVSALPRRSVAFHCLLRREVVREPSALLDPEMDRSRELLLVCSVCKRVKTGHDWLEAEAALNRRRLFEALRLPRLLHTVCPPCHRQVLREIGGT